MEISLPRPVGCNMMSILPKRDVFPSPPFTESAETAVARRKLINKTFLICSSPSKIPFPISPVASSRTRSAPVPGGRSSEPQKYPRRARNVRFGKGGKEGERRTEGGRAERDFVMDLRREGGQDSSSSSGALKCNKPPPSYTKKLCGCRVHKSENKTLSHRYLINNPSATILHFYVLAGRPVLSKAAI